MTKTKPKARRQMLILFCALLLFGQIFVSDTNRQHLDETVEAVGSDYRIFTVDNGVCRQEGGMQ